MREAHALDRNSAGWLLASATITLAPHATSLPQWTSALAALLLAWQGWRILRHAPPPPRWLLLAIVGAAIVGVVLSFRTPVGKDPGVALLAAFLSLKLLESRNARDGYAVVFLCYFMQLAQFFESQSIATAGLTLVGTGITTAALTTLNTVRLTARARLKLSALMLAQALPFMLALFVLFPRIESPLWGLPADAFNAMSGLSDSMSPGSISELSLSGAVAFRARFNTAPPAPAQLYWRGPVMAQFDGRTWRPATTRGSGQRPYVTSGPAVEYELTLEPHNRPWLFALELPDAAPPEGWFTHDYQLLSRTPVRKRIRYALRAYPATRAGMEEREDVLRENLRLPSGFNPRTRELAQTLRGQTSGTRELINVALEFYRRNPFTYTLSPPLLGRDSVDEFLFDTRSGFCEHFASSFVFLMRAAGVPARVVTGYQGGEINPVDQYLVVRQSDAHAWAEAWIEGEGWRRIDPTATVAPSRIERGLADAMPVGEPLPLALRPTLPWLRELRFRWEAVGNSWNQWVLGYNPQRQKELLRRLGMRSPDWYAMTLAMSVICGVLMLGLTAWALSQRTRVDPVQRTWLALSRRLARIGLQRLAWEGPADYAQRVGAARPALREAMNDAARLYASLRYGQRSADRNALRQLRTLINAIHP